jgi:hypothetical protein
MLGRLALVVYWICTGFAVLCGVGAVLALANNNNHDMFAVWLLAILGAVSFGIGRAVRYVVLGR